MASIFDYFVEPEKRASNRIQLKPIPRKPQVIAFDPFAPVEESAPRIQLNDILTQKTAEEPLNIPAERERIVLSPLPEPVESVENPSITLSPIRQAENELAALKNTPVGRKNKGFGGRLVDGLREAVISAGNSYNQSIQSGMRPDEALFGSIGGAAVGGVSGAVLPINERRIRLYDINKKQGEIEQMRKEEDRELEQQAKRIQLKAITDKPQNDRAAAQRDFQYKLALEEQKRQAEGGKYDIETDGQGRKFRVYKNDPSKALEPILDPQTGEQLTDPSKAYYDIYSPSAGANVKASGNTIVAGDATLANANANREQQTRQYNASQEFEAQKTNVANAIKYNEAVAAQMDAIQKQGGQNIANLGEVQGLNAQIQTLNEQLQQIAQNPEFETDENLRKQYNSILTKFGEAQAKFQSALGKTSAGVEVLNGLKARGLDKPQTVRAVKIQAVQSQPNRGRYSGMNFVLDNNLRSRFKGRSDAQIREIIQGQGGKVQ